MSDDLQNEIYEMVQDYLKTCPLIIWGSGGTIPFGMPSMDDLKKELKINEEGNLEEILSKSTDEETSKDYESRIYQIINKKDIEFRNTMGKDTSKIVHLKNIISYFYNAHPRNINIITTNYDCILEYIFSYYDFPFSDGFSGYQFSGFKKENFSSKSNHINLYKVHGSLRWDEKRYSYDNIIMDAVFPNNQKYRKVTEEPYRTIIAKSDEAIEGARCFLAVGFGFNDEHITPKLQTAINNENKIVIITKKATKSTVKQLKEAPNCILIEKGEREYTTKFSLRRNNQEKIATLSGEYWKIEQFNNILRAD